MTDAFDWIPDYPDPTLETLMTYGEPSKPWQPDPKLVARARKVTQEWADRFAKHGHIYDDLWRRACRAQDYLERASVRRHD